MDDDIRKSLADILSFLEDEREARNDCEMDLNARLDSVATDVKYLVAHNRKPWEGVLPYSGVGRPPCPRPTVGDYEDRIMNWLEEAGPNGLWRWTITNRVKEPGIRKQALENLLSKGKIAEIRINSHRYFIAAKFADAAPAHN